MLQIEQTTIIKPWHPQDPDFFQQPTPHPPPPSTQPRFYASLLWLSTLDRQSMSSRSPSVAQAAHQTKPPAQTKNGLSTRQQTTMYGSLSTGRTKEDLIRSPPFSSNIKTLTLAQQCLSNYTLIPPNQPPDHSSLAQALLNVAVTGRGMTAPVADVIRSVAIIINTLAPSNPQAGAPPSASPPTPPQDLPPALDEQLTLLSTYLTDFRSLLNQGKSSSADLTLLVSTTQESLQASSQKIESTANDLRARAAHLANQPPSAFPPHTYADTTRSGAPPVAVAKCFSQSRTIRISPPPGDNSLADLNEEFLVKKANLALDLARPTALDLPVDAEFISARRTAQGHILYLVESDATATWLRSPTGMKEFTSNFGAEVSLSTKPFPVLVEFVPIQFNPDDPNALREVERRSSLPPGSIKSSRWIKPVARRSTNQRKAHITVDLLTPDHANHVIRTGLTIAGAQCPARKLLPEPTRCLKCQSFEGSHFAKDCRSQTDTCSTCGGNHRSADCNDRDRRYCANCKRTGHASWDRACPVFQEKTRKYRAHISDAKYKYYPVKDDTSTWELDTPPEHKDAPPRMPPQGKTPTFKPSNPSTEWKTNTRKPIPPAASRKPRPFPMPPPDNSQSRLTDSWLPAQTQPFARPRSTTLPSSPPSSQERSPSPPPS